MELYLALDLDLVSITTILTRKVRTTLTKWFHAMYLMTATRNGVMAKKRKAAARRLTRLLTNWKIGGKK